ncbi:phytanoyl-CoA dioxygenase family protein [Rhizobium hainanense]|uniref:Phytanoyl-CoA dioxygenase (PhyH) n=1 Tax=Rhizobium hainanense TaxID=52131 RepID=A0A1C3V1X0_9HYPH|nr:phytanoyl-CoA dioxygenase family protein [Rhizobium hainanense]SCB21731.1 Phytanoyl-CoA dioxygenase (PhyH) [Rhizobium hainanense]
MHNPPARDLESVARQGSRFKRMAVRIPTYLTDLKENPAWLPMFLLARTLPFRRMHWFATKQPVRLSVSGPSMFADVERGAVVKALRTDGIYPNLMLPDHIHQEIAEFALATGCYGNFNRQLEFVASEHRQAEARFGRPILSGHFFERSLDCEAVMAVQLDPLLVDVARQYLGGQAKVITTRIWWSFPTQASEADRSLASLDKYHFDLDDWRMLKFFFNLVDVDEGTGPHVFVKGSHKRRRVRHQLTLLVGHPANEVLDYYGQANALTLTGKAGSGFVEDPFGFHMGTVPTQKPRLMMEVGFGVSKPSQRRFHGEPVLR